MRSPNDRDRVILDLLARDSRLSLKQIGSAAGLSGSAVQERIARLVKDGLIEASPSSAEWQKPVRVPSCW